MLLKSVQKEIAVDLIKYFGNSINVIKRQIDGKSLSSFKSIKSTQYPPTKFLMPQHSKIHIQCIMCGFPRAGTHWIRNVIEKSTGRETYDLNYKRPSPLNKDVLLIKIHARSKFIARLKALWKLPRFDFGGKYIYVYRDPRDAIISLYEMYKRIKAIDDLDQEHFLNIYDPIGQYSWEINRWVVPNHKDVLLVKFENLKLNSLEEFSRIFRFLCLDFPIAAESIGKLVATTDEKKRPRGTAYGWKNAPIDYKFIIDTVNSRLEREIKLLGYE